MQKTALSPAEKIRNAFPILEQKVNGKPLIYFDNAATSQKPLRVIHALDKYYREYNSNVHRGVHTLSRKATAAQELTREKAKSFLNAAEKEEIIFTSGTTEGINLIAQSWGRKNLNKGNIVLLSMMEHHSNIVPWQLICEEKGADINVIPINEAGEIIQDEFDKLLTPNVKLLSLAHVSNALGTINPVKQMIQKAHKNGTIVCIDGAQAVPHLKVDVQDLDVDFYVFSSHKMYGPTGVGILYGKKGILEKMTPYKGGGEMIDRVTFEKTTYNEIPFKFEAGTPNIADIIAFGEAIEFMRELFKEDSFQHEEDLLDYATTQLLNIEGLRIYGTAKEKTGVISFNIGNTHPYDLGMLLDSMGIAIRTGHHCTQPLMDWYGIDGTARVSFACYNTKNEVDALVEGINRAKKILEKG